MPELPEVEVTRRQIGKVLLDREIESVTTTAPSYFFITPPRELERRLLGRRVRELARVGKYLVATLDDGSSLLLHLGMTGQLFASGASSLRLLVAKRKGALAPEAQPAFVPDLHTHLILGFEDSGPRVYFRDVRKFGKVAWAPPGVAHERLADLGPDALLATGAGLWAATRKRSAPIKSLLLDQTVLAGVGNIYADEALFLAGVRVTRPSRRLTRAECDAIAEALRQVLRRSIRTGGSSISDYVRPDGSDGGYQNERRVYAREGQDCYVCRTAIRRLVLGQRSSHFCPQCQR